MRSGSTGCRYKLIMMRDDPQGDIKSIEELVSQAGGELFLYDGDAHLFTDSSLDAYDLAAAKLVIETNFGVFRRPLVKLESVADPFRAK